jgi:glycine betaine/choline ABC-type transport system substrate-binding protein
VLLLLALPSCRSQREQRIVVGAKNFTEQVILAELLAQHLESRLSLDVERRINLGGTLIAHEALRAGEIDVYVEYTGTALTVVLGEVPTGSEQDTFRRVQAGYASRFGLEVLDSLGFENTFALVVRGDDARRLKLTSISDLQPYSQHWRTGFGYEFMERPDGFKGLVKTYQLQFDLPTRTLDLGLLYRALIEKQVDIVAGNSTDGVISALDLVVLRDDRHYFPPYEAVPIVRRQSISQHPAMLTALRELHGKITESEVRELNYAVDGEHQDVKQVVRKFLRAKEL